MSADKNGRQWRKLDNAAKIFPATSTRRDPRVFRFACALLEDINPHALQLALDKTLQRFSFYRSVLKRGLFWYYFEEQDLRPLVQQEDLPPCAPIYNKDKKGLLFRVSYFGKRINLEVYHALTDGTGALHFLRTSVCYYLHILYPYDFKEKVPSLEYDASAMQRTDDSFHKYYDKDHYGRQSIPVPRSPNAHKQRSGRLPEDRISVIEGEVSVKAAISKAKEYNATLTQFFMAVMACSIYPTMTLREMHKPVVIAMPVNLRSFFPSESARNFFSIVKISYDFRKQEKDLPSVIAHIKKEIEENLTEENLNLRMNQMSSLENSIWMKLIPLVLKDPILYLFNHLTEKKVTTAFSNVGKVSMPAEYSKYIRSFDVFIHANRMQACMCSFGDHLTISFTSPFDNTDVQRCFFRTLADMGLAVELASNGEQADSSEVKQIDAEKKDQSVGTGAETYN